MKPLVVVEKTGSWNRERALDGGNDRFSAARYQGQKFSAMLSSFL